MRYSVCFILQYLYPKSTFVYVLFKEKLSILKQYCLHWTDRGDSLEKAEFVIQIY